MMQSAHSQQTRKWTDRQDAPQLVSLTSVLAKLVRSEDKKWLQYNSTAASGSRDESLLAHPQASAGLTRKGEIPLPGGERISALAMSSDFLVEHGKLTNRIHDYFGMLERNRVLLNIGSPRTFNNMRVVKGGNDVGDGSDTTTTCGPNKAVVLAGEELHLYRSCLMCAQFPALCTPELPSPSPSIVANTHYLSPDAGKSSRPPYELSSPSDGLLQELPSDFRASPELAGLSASEDHDVVTVDGLKMYVRNVFKQTEQQQLGHERDLREMNGRRNPAEILAKELVTQLSFLESNSQPYYQLQSFVNKNAYDQWAQWEKQKIRHLISLFWQYCYPRPVLKGRRHDYHDLYRKLLSKVVSLETKTVKGRHHIVLKDSAPSRPLSAKATRLLREFGLRFGVAIQELNEVHYQALTWKFVGEMYRRLVYLDYLARHFENDIWYIQHTSAVLSSVQDLLPTDSSKMVITKDELDMLATSVTHLHREAEHSLTRIKRLFPQNGPPEGLASLIELLRTALCGYQYVKSGVTPPSLGECLQQYITDGFTKSYERHKTIAQAEMGVLSVVQPVTPELISSILTFIQDEVESYRNYFQVSFQEFFDVTELAATEFYRMLCDDVASLCRKYVQAHDQLDLEMLSLAYKLTELDEMWSVIITPEMQVWRDHFFSKHADMWLDGVHNQLVDWVVKSVACDEWAILSLSPSSQRPLSSGWPKSSSPDAEVEVGSPKPTSVLKPSSRSAFSSVSRVKGEDLGMSCLVNQPSSYNGSIASQQSGSTISMVESIGSRLSSISTGRLSGPNEDELMASLEQTSQMELPLSIFANRVDMDQGPGADAPDDKRSRLLTFGAMSSKQGDEVKQSPSIVRRTRLLVERKSVDKDEVHHGGSKQRKTSRKRSQTNGISCHRNAAVESNSLENATPVAISISRPSLLRTMSNFSLNQTSSPVVVHPQPTATLGGGESSSRLIPVVTVKANSSAQKKAGFGHSMQSPHESRLCSQMQSPEKCQPAVHVVDHDSQKSLECNVPTATLASDASSVLTTNEYDDGSWSSEASGESRPSLSDSLTGITEGTFCPIHNASPSKPPMLPVSSSVIDIITALIRMAKFTGRLNHVLTPRPSSNSQSTSLADVSQRSSSEWSCSSTKYEIGLSVDNVEDSFGEKLLEVLNCNLAVYVSNMLCTDLCIVNEQVARYLIGDELLSKIEECKQQQLLWGCRHMVPLGQQPHDYHVVPDCLQYEKTGQRHDSETVFERVTFDMCIRINNVTALRGVLPALHDLLMRVAGIHKSFTPNQGSTPSFDSGYYYGSPAQVTNGSSCAPVKQNHVCREANVSQQSCSSAISSVASGSSFLHGMGERLAGVEKAQIRLMCYRLNNFIKRSLNVLLSLTLPEKQYPLARRLDPVVKYVNRHLYVLGYLLYPQTFTSLLQCLWDCIVSNFKQFADNLLKAKKDSRNIALLYLRAIAFLVEFFHAGGAGLDMDVLVTNAKYVFELLELHALSTRKLISIYNKLSQQEETASLSDAIGTFPPPLINDLRHSLHRLRKCFTGREFTDTVVALRTKSSASVDVNDTISASLSHTGIGEYDYAVQLGQQLLDGKVIQRVTKVEDYLHRHIPTPLGEQNQFMGSTSHLYTFVTYEDRTDLSCSSFSSVSSNDETTESDLSEKETDSTTTHSGTRSSTMADSICVRKIITSRSRYDKHAKQFA